MASVIRLNSHTLFIFIPTNHSEHSKMSAKTCLLLPAVDPYAVAESVDSHMSAPKTIEHVNRCVRALHLDDMYVACLSIMSLVAWAQQMQS